MREIFKELSKEEVSVVENQITENWQKMNILDLCLEKKNKTFVFYDGPATANGMPGLHHMVSKNLKDCICKYRAMKGNRIVRKVGWDTHGLPIENHVEKKLNFVSKRDIEEFGIGFLRRGWSCSRYYHSCR